MSSADTARVTRVQRTAPIPDYASPARVSVVIPCFNYARYLPEAVSSVLEQSKVDVDVIVVDDASTDDSLQVARRLAEADSRVQVIGRPRNGGPVETFNLGLRAAKGEFLVRLDADDLLTPGALHRAAALMRAYPQVGLVYGRPLHFRTDLPKPRTRARSWTVWSGMQWLADRCEDGCNVITSPEVLMRMSVVRRIGGQRPLAHTHDMEMWLRMSAFADVAYVAGADQAWHREHPASLSAREVDQIVDLRERAAAFYELVTGPARSQPGVVDLGTSAVRQLSREALAKCKHELDRGRRPVERIDALLGIAAQLDPNVKSTAEWQAIQRRLDHRPGSVAKIIGLPEGVQSRWKYLRRHYRWLTTGSYLPTGARRVRRWSWRPGMARQSLSTSNLDQADQGGRAEQQHAGSSRRVPAIFPESAES